MRDRRPRRGMPLNGPRGLHVSLTGDAASSRAVTWFTDGTEAGPSLLEFDTVTPAMSASDIQTMPMAVQAEGSADATPGVEAYTHRASVEVLDPSLPFRYRVGDGESWSDVCLFYTSDAADDIRCVHLGGRRRLTHTLL